MGTRMSQLGDKTGFTLTEIMIVLVILGVSIGLAVPAYFSTVEQSRHNEAVNSLNIINMGEKIYRINNNAFWAPATNPPATGNGAGSMNNMLSIDIPTGGFFDITSIT